MRNLHETRGEMFKQTTPDFIISTTPLSFIVNKLSKEETFSIEFCAGSAYAAVWQSEVVCWPSGRRPRQRCPFPAPYTSATHRAMFTSLCWK